MDSKITTFLRYPGSKRRMLAFLLKYLPSREALPQRFVEPFVGGGAIFFALNPRRALLSDVNNELIDLYRAIRESPTDVWRSFASFPSTKEGYYQIRDTLPDGDNLMLDAARTLYLNRTCFKGMWRYNSEGRFNVGYGGQDRRWVLSEQALLDISARLQSASLMASDFEVVIEACLEGDFIFADPPYRPGARELSNDHYLFNTFAFADHKRLARALKAAGNRGVRWALTTSAHPEILDLFPDESVVRFWMGTGTRPGQLVKNAREVIIRSEEHIYEEGVLA
jgi:DNA adenine methylase